MRAKLIAAALLAIAPAFSLPAHAQGEDNWPADCKLERVAQLPMMLMSGHVVIPATANGKPLTLGIDTGGFGSSLTEASADRMGIPSPYRKRLGAVVPGISGWWASRGSALVDMLQIGDLKLAHIFLPVMMAFPDVDGLIGPDILAKYDAEFDYAGMTFRLFRAHPCAGRAVSWTKSYIAVPFIFTANGHVRVRVTVDGVDADAILDTGAPVSVLSTEDAHALFGLDPRSAGVEAVTPVSGPAWGGGPVHAYASTFKTLTIGSMTIPHPRMELIEGRNFLGKDFATLVLGNDILSRFHLYIAYREQKLYLSDAEAQ